MTKIDITDKIIRIECSNPNCQKEFMKSIDELEESGIVTCPICEQEHFLTLKN